MGIGARLKQAREIKHLTQKELGSLVGVTGSAITNYENETSHPKEQILYKLIDALEVDANFLFQDSVKISSSKSISPSEYTHIQKYRMLDDYGRKNVDTVLENEYARCNETKAIPLCKTTDSYNIYEDENHSEIINYSESLTRSLVAEPSGFYSVHTLAAHERKDATEEGKQSDYDLIRKIKENNGGGGAKRE